MGMGSVFLDGLFVCTVPRYVFGKMENARRVLGGEDGLLEWVKSE